MPMIHHIANAKAAPSSRLIPDVSSEAASPASLLPSASKSLQAEIQSNNWLHNSTKINIQ